MSANMEAVLAEEKKVSLAEMFLLYLRIGLTGFGPAMAAETKKNIVKKRKWISEEEFLNGLALAQLLPGATFVSLTVYIGYRLRGISGALIELPGVSSAILFPHGLAVIPLLWIRGIAYHQRTF